MLYKNIIEKIERELQPLETAFHNMLKQKTLKPETRDKILKNLNAFTALRNTISHNTENTSSICHQR